MVRRGRQRTGTGWLPFRSSLAVSGNRMRSRNPERGLRMSSLYAEYLPLYGPAAFLRPAMLPGVSW